MAVSNGMLVVGAVVAVVAVAAEAIVRHHEIQEMDRTIVELSTRVESIDAAVNQASAAATQAAATADQANAAATRANEAIDRSAIRAAPVGLMGHPANVSAVAAGHDRAVLICAACHVVSPEQQLAPIKQPPAPAFSAIMNRPATTESGLRDYLLTPHGDMPDLSREDQQVNELIAYMMTLREHR